MRRFLLVAVAVLAATAATTGFAGRSSRSSARAQRSSVLTPLQKRLLSGAASEAVLPGSAPSAAAKARRAPARQRQVGGGSSSADGCPVARGSNVRTNQDCLNLTDPDLQGRGQAQNETSIAQDKRDPSRLVASSNDYRRGDGGCYAYYSGDGGRSWHDSTPPMGFVRGAAFGGVARQYWQGGGDTSVAFDTKGNAYLSCQAFNRGANGLTNNPDQSSGLYVLRSTATGGASWNFPARPVVEANDVDGAGAPFLDKQLMTVDDTVGSPFQDRVYVTWTLFAADGTAYIYAAHSADYGETFSAPVLVSKDSDLCPLTLGLATPQGRCNANQFSQPFTGPDGALYVTWANFNVTDLRPSEDDTGGDGNAGDRQAQAAPAEKDNRAQVLLARSTDGGQTFSAPVKVSDYYDLPDCDTYQGKDAGRACVPEKGQSANSFFRAANYPVGAVDPKRAGRVYVTFGSYLNQHSNEDSGCVPQGLNPDTTLPLYDGVKKTGACNNDIVVSRSDDGGATFTGTTTDVRRLPSVQPRDGQADQWFQWAAVTGAGRLAVSYYDRRYGDDEQTGYSDVSLSGSGDGRTFASRRVTTGSMPPPTQFEGVFFGDYAGLAAVNGTVHPAWSDTRDLDLLACRSGDGSVSLPPSVCTFGADNAPKANDQNAYTRSLPVP